MKTNASPKTIIRAVEKVSAEKYKGNVVFMNYPKKITKNVARFTLRTKDVNKPGSMVTKAGQKQPKVNWEVQQDVMDEILRMSPYPNIYVDTLYGRKFSEVEFASDELVNQAESSHLRINKGNSEPVVSEEQPRTKRKYTKRSAAKAAKVEKQVVAEAPKKRGRPLKKLNGTMKKAIKYLKLHPELLVA